MEDKEKLEELDEYELEKYEPLTEAPEDEENTDTDISDEGEDVGDETNENLEEENEPEFSLSDLGKVYVLKNIYSTLNTLYTYSEQLLIQNSYNEHILKIQEYIQEVKELFLLIAYNLDKYLEKLDSIIDLLQKAIKLIAMELQKYEQTNTNDNKEDNTN